MIYKNLNIKLLTTLVHLVPLSLILGSFVLNLNLIVITFILVISFIFDKKIFEYLNIRWLQFSVLLMIYQVISSIINDANPDSIIRSIGLIKFIGLAGAMLIIFENNSKNFIIFLKILFFVSLFIIFDSLLQFFLGENLTGNKYSNSRLSSIFGNEYIVGAFLSKVAFIVLILPFLIIKNDYLKELSILCLLISLVVTILLSGERMASLLMMMGILIYYFFKGLKNPKKFLYLIVISFVILFVFLSSNNVAKRFKEISHERYGLTKDLKIKNSKWGAHFLTAYEIFKDNPIIGVGPKNFRNEVCKKKYENIDSTRASQRCTTHPHNVVLEILSEQGILGMMLFLTILYHLLKGINLFREICLLSFISFLIFLWPIGTAGSIFTSWNGTFLWINFAILFFLKRNSKKYES